MGEEAFAGRLLKITLNALCPAEVQQDPRDIFQAASSRNRGTHLCGRAGPAVVSVEGGLEGISTRSGLSSRGRALPGRQSAPMELLDTYIQLYFPWVEMAVSALKWIIT